MKQLEGKKARVGVILKILEREYGQLESGLRFENPFQLLIAVILSAQCTDVRVNRVTKGGVGRGDQGMWFVPE